MKKRHTIYKKVKITYKVNKEEMEWMFILKLSTLLDEKGRDIPCVDQNHSQYVVSVTSGAWV